MNLLRTLAGCILAICLVSPADAISVPAVDIDPHTQVGDPPGPGQYQGFDYGNLNSVIGWSFAVEEAITLTHLGWFDENGDGLSHEHRLGLWRTEDSANFDLVVEVTLSSGTEAELTGPWRRAAIDYIGLPAGAYVIGGLDNSSSTDIVKYVADSNALMRLPIDRWLGALTVGSLRFDNTFAVPDQTLAAPGLFLGPMFFIEPVPEPGSIALFAIGAVLVVPMERSRMKCQA